MYDDRCTMLDVRCTMYDVRCTMFWLTRCYEPDGSSSIVHRPSYILLNVSVLFLWLQKQGYASEQLFP